MKQDVLEIDRLLEWKATPLSFRFSMLAKRYYGAAASSFRDLSIDNYFFVLLLIDKNQHISQQVLSDQLGVDKAMMVRIIDHLAEHKLVKREQDPRDRRAYCLISTPEGTKMAARVEQVFRDLNEQVMKGLDKKERKQFLKALDLVLDNLNQLPKEQYQLKYVKK